MKYRLFQIIVLSICILSLRVEVYASGVNDSLYTSPLLVYFRFDNATVESAYMGNGRTLAAFGRLFGSRQANALLDSITITSFSSPEGSRVYNQDLSFRRANAVKSHLLREYPHLDRNLIRTAPQGENWQGLRELIARDPAVPDRYEVLQILDVVKDTERCKMLLRRLNCGYAYKYIEENILHRLRNATVCIVKLKSGKVEILTSSMREAAFVPAYRQRILYAGIAEETEYFPAEYFPTGNLLPAKHPAFRPRFALKTNLLYDLATAPNIELEIPLGRNARWSIDAEWTFPWWLFSNDKYCFQLLSGGLEARYWLGNRVTRRSLAGHFLGLYAGGGKYDLQWETNGYQGEFYIASGISYGYSAAIARRLNLEFSIGIGLLRTDYRHYHATDNYKTLLWQDSGTYTWFGPTKLKIALVWLLGQRKKGETK